MLGFLEEVQKEKKKEKERKQSDVIHDWLNVAEGFCKHSTLSFFLQNARNFQDFDCQVSVARTYKSFVNR